jgi:DNA-binding transcriptional regulator YiaG
MLLPGAKLRHLSPMSMMDPADRVRMPRADASYGERPAATGTVLAEQRRRTRACQPDARASNRVQITSAQIRAARALLNLSGRRLSQRSGISPSTLHRAENAEGKPNLHASTLIAIKATLEALGVEFLDDTGVRLVRTRVETWIMRKDSFV